MKIVSTGTNLGLDKLGFVLFEILNAFTYAIELVLNLGYKVLWAVK